MELKVDHILGAILAHDEHDRAALSDEQIFVLNRWKLMQTEAIVEDHFFLFLFLEGSGKNSVVKTSLN